MRPTASVPFPSVPPFAPDSRRTCLTPLRLTLLILSLTGFTNPCNLTQITEKNMAAQWQQQMQNQVNTFEKLATYINVTEDEK